MVLNLWNDYKNSFGAFNIFQEPITEEEILKKYNHAVTIQNKENNFFEKAIMFSPPIIDACILMVYIPYTFFSCISDSDDNKIENFLDKDNPKTYSYVPQEITDSIKFDGYEVCEKYISLVKKQNRLLTLGEIASLKQYKNIVDSSSDYIKGSKSIISDLTKKMFK